MKYKKTLVLVVLFLMFKPLLAQWNEIDDPFYDFRGFNPTRESHPYEPLEYFDPFTGNLTLIYNEVSLPGKGGLDLNIVRAYNSNIYRSWDFGLIEPVPPSWVGLGWSLHMGRLVEPFEEDFRYLIMPDGSKHKFYSKIGSTDYISKDFWILRQNGSDWEVMFTDGVKWIFNGTIIGSFFDPVFNDDVIYYPTWKIQDPSGTNEIVISYTNTGYNEAVMTQIEDTYGRTITFTLDGTGNSLATMTVNDNDYSFEYIDYGIADHKLLQAVYYPVDAGGYATYQYTYREDQGGNWPTGEMLTRTQPWGGVITYDYVTHGFTVNGVDFEWRRLSTRAVDGGIWQIYYDQYNEFDRTKIEYHRGQYLINRTHYIMYGYLHAAQHQNNWLIGLVRTKIIDVDDGCDDPEIWINYFHNDYIVISNDYYKGPFTWDIGVNAPLVTDMYWTEYPASAGYTTLYGDFDDYGNPQYMTQYGGGTIKYTSMVYWYNTDKNIIRNIEHKDVYFTNAASEPHHIEHYTYVNETGKVSSQTINGITTTYTYDSNKNLYQITDGEGRYTRYSQYSNGIPNVIYNGLYTVQRGINWEGTIAWEQDGNDNTTHYYYDDNNRLSIINPPLGNNTYIYYAPNNTFKTVARGDGWTMDSYDGFGRVILTQNGAGVKITTSYYPNGWLEKKSLPFDDYTEEVFYHYTYDFIGRMTWRSLCDPWEIWHEQFMHTYVSGLPCVIYRDQTNSDHETRYQYRVFGNSFNSPKLARVLMYYTPTNYIGISYHYNNNAEKITQISTDDGYHRDFTYENGRIELLQSEQSPERGLLQYSYENNGNLESRTDAYENITSYTYDAANRLIGIDYPKTIYDVTYAYDDADNCILVETPQAIKHYGYDRMNRITGDTLQIDGYEFKMYYSYDDNGNLEYINYPDNSVVQYTYDNENRVITIPGYIENDIQYHPSGHESWYETTNGCQTSYTFYNDRHLIQRITVLPSIIDEEYEYDDFGNLTSITDHLNANNNMTFTYDGLHRLVNFNAPNLWGYGTYTYENVYLGRRTTENINGNITNYYYNEDTKILDYTTGLYDCDFYYDEKGDLNGITGDKYMNIKYDYDNRPVSILNRQNRQEVTCIYDGNGNRVKRIGYFPKESSDENRPPTTGTPVYYMYSPWGSVFYECRMFEVGPQELRYVFLNNRHLARTGGSVILFYHNDYLGTPKMMTDYSQRILYQWIGYPFGQEYWSRESYFNYFRFTGKEFDESNGMYYFGARYYMPEFGIFITPEQFKGTEAYNLDDPLSLKFYDYCRNNPYRFVDPTGEWFTREENENIVVYRLKSAEMHTRRSLQLLPVVGGIVSVWDCIVRSASHDRTLEGKDWVWAVANVFVSAGGLGITLSAEVFKYVDYKFVKPMSFDDKEVYRITTQYVQAQYLDPKIFETLSSEYGLEEIDTGGQIKIVIPKDKNFQKIYKDLWNYSIYAAERLKKEDPTRYYHPW